MGVQRSQLYWGLVLLVLGALFLGVNLGVIPKLAANAWALVFTVVAVLFFAGYLTAGLRNWGLLFPAVGAGAIAATIWMAEAHVPGDFIGGTFMAAISLPFLVAFLTGPRENWWALIPGWTLLAIAGIVFAANRVPDELMASLVMFAIGLPFVVVYLVRRTQWWALIPGGIMTALGVVLLFANILRGELFAALMMLGFATPFFAVYYFNRKHWWALIPGGVMLTIAVALLTVAIPIAEAMRPNVMGAIMFGGIGLVFGALWLLRAQAETGWAKYPAAVLLAMAVIIFFAGPQSNIAWAAALVLLGLWLLYRSFRQPQEPGKPQELR